MPIIYIPKDGNHLKVLVSIETHAKLRKLVSDENKTVTVVLEEVLGKYGKISEETIVEYLKNKKIS